MVDDDFFNILVLVGLLKSAKVPFDEAQCGMDALDKVSKRIELVKTGAASMYKLILLDFSMPDLNGPQVAIQLRGLLADDDIQ